MAYAAKRSRREITSFVDREDVLQEFYSVCKEANEGRGRVVIVSGEAGVGKTRLVQEAARKAVESGWQFLSGRCVSQKNGDPYLPFVDALREQPHQKGEDESMPGTGFGVSSVGLSAGRSAPAGGEDVLGVGLVTMTGSGEELADFQNERGRVFGALVDRVMDLSAKNPVLLFIDDLQWADDATLQLLYYLALNISQARVVICCACRGADAPGGEPDREGMEEVLRRVRLECDCVEFELKALARGDMAAMVRNIFDAPDTPEEFTEKLYELSEGNPLFVEEVSRALMDEGVVGKGRGAWERMDPSLVKMPTTLRDAATKKIAALDSQAKRALMYAVVIGERFAFELLHEVTAMDADDLLDALDRLIALGLVREDRGSRDGAFAISNSHAASVIYDEMTGARLRHMHRKVGEALERSGPERHEELAFALARHFSMARDYRRTFRYAVMAGDKSRKLLALEDAVGYYESAIEALGSSHGNLDADAPRETARLRLIAGDCEFILGNLTTSDRHLSEAVRSARATGDGGRLSLALRRLADVRRMVGKIDDAEKLFAEALSISERASDMSGKSEIYLGLGNVYWRRGDNARAEGYFGQCLELARAAGDPQMLGRAYSGLAIVRSVTADMEMAVDYYGKALLELEKAGDSSELARVLNNLGSTYMELGDWDMAISNFERSMESARKVNNRRYIAWALFNSAEAYSNTGRPDKAIEYCGRSMRICEANGDKMGIYEVYKNYGIAYRAKCEFGRALEQHSKSIELAKEVGIPHAIAKMGYEMAVTSKAAGERELAAKLFKEARELFSKIGEKTFVERITKENPELDDRLNDS